MEGFNFAALDFSSASNPLAQMEWADTGVGSNSSESNACRKSGQSGICPRSD